MYATMRLCSGGGGFEAIPHPRSPLDLAAARRVLEAAGVPVVDARVMLIAKLDREVTIARDGRILVKTRAPEEAERVLRDVCARLSLPFAPEGTAAEPNAAQR
jgi:hypothetical protein